MFSFPTINEIAAALGGKLIILMVLMFVDLLFGVIVSLVNKEFQWEYLTNYLSTGFLPILGWLAVGVISFIPNEYIPSSASMIAETTVYGTVFLKLLASILGSFGKIGILTDQLKTIGISKK